MARVMVMLWVFPLFVVTANAAQGIGMNWGSQCTHCLLPSVVVQLLKDNGIKKVKLFDADSWTVKAFAGTGIEVMVGIPNADLKRLSHDYDAAEDWVKANITTQLHDGGVDIRYVAVGNEPFLKSYNGSYLKTTLPAMENIQKAINKAGHGSKIKITTPLNADVYESSGLPSAGDFRSDIKSYMVDLVRWLNSNGSPFLVNIYPFLSLYQNKDFPFEFAFFDGQGKSLPDDDITYKNVFDANFDTLVYALKKAGFPDMKIVVGEAGWPTDGSIFANNKLAAKFYNGFLKKLASNEGTPLRPGHMEVYLFGLLDEDQKSLDPGDFERHWGIFRFDGQPKFPIDFTGKGQAKLPIAAKGVEYLERKWCVVDRSVKNLTTSLVGANMDFACARSDCSALKYGSSCNKLDLAGNLSYAFNMYYQANDQDVEACAFQGMATITKTDPSTDTCFFPVQIESAGTRPKGVSFMIGLVVTLWGLFVLF